METKLGEQIMGQYMAMKTAHEALDAAADRLFDSLLPDLDALGLVTGGVAIIQIDNEPGGMKVDVTGLGYNTYALILVIDSLATISRVVTSGGENERSCGAEDSQVQSTTVP